jgi:hypothetical protein
MAVLQHSVPERLPCSQARRKSAISVPGRSAGLKYLVRSVDTLHWHALRVPPHPQLPRRVAPRWTDRFRQ